MTSDSTRLMMCPRLMRFRAAVTALLGMFFGMAGEVRGQVVISQIYGGGGNSGALIRSDFVELFNRGNEPVPLAGWSIQYASSASASWQVLALTGEIGPGRHYLVRLAPGGTNGVLLPPADVTGGMNLSASAGKVALVRALTALSGVCPVSDSIADLAGYGSAASCFEGAGPAPAPSSTRAVFRALNGCRDTGDNAADFFTAAPLPRNSQEPPDSCTAPITRSLHEIQGPAGASSLVGQTIITTTNIITAVTSDGFFLQAPDAENDGNPATPEAVFVSTPDGLPALAQVSNAVVVTGFVEEFRAASDPAELTRTQLIQPLVEWIAVNQPLPTAVVIATNDWAEVPSLADLERFEGMRVRMESLTVVSATEGFIQEAAATGISDGVFYSALPGMNWPLREPGIMVWDALPADAPAGVPRFDGNPERFRIDSNAQIGARRIEVAAGSVVSGMTGVLDFQQRAWTLLPDADSAHSVSGSLPAAPIHAATSNEILLASLNLQRFFDTVDDPGLDEAVLTAAAFAGRLNKASLAIREILRAPDVLGLLEVENLSALQALAERVNSDLQANGIRSPRYAAWLEEGNDIGGIDSGFLVNTARVEVVEVIQAGKSATYLNPLTGESDTVNDRPPLILRASVPRGASRAPLSFTIVLNHLRSMSAIDHPTEGVRVRAKRRAQAEFLARLIQQRQLTDTNENLLVLGDFNAFEFNDGYVDVMGTITGQPAPAGAVTLASDDLVNPDLVNLTALLPALERYSYSFDGNLQAIDHVLVNATLRPRVTRHGYARGNVDFPESFRGDFNRPERLSDHDAAAVWIAVVIQPRVEVLTVGDERVELHVRGEPNQSMRVEHSGDLKVWEETGRVVMDNHGNGAFSAPLNRFTQGSFFRLAIP